MKVQELIDALGDQDPEAEVMYTYNYGDHWRTTVAAEIRDVDAGAVEWSEYHRMNKVAERGDEIKVAVLLS